VRYKNSTRLLSFCCTKQASEASPQTVKIYERLLGRSFAFLVTGFWMLDNRETETSQAAGLLRILSSIQRQETSIA